MLVTSVLAIISEPEGRFFLEGFPYSSLTPIAGLASRFLLHLVLESLFLDQSYSLSSRLSHPTPYHCVSWVQVLM
jgi:hypothetical protein